MNGQVEILTRNEGWRRLLTSNTTASSFAATAPTITAPVSSATVTGGSGVFSIGTPATSFNAQKLQLMVYGAGADDTTVLARVWGWQQQVTDGTPTLWIPTILAQLTCTLGTSTGVNGYTPADTDRIADIYAADTGFPTTAVELVTPNNNTGGAVFVQTRGFSKLQIDFQMGTATNANCLYRVL